MINTAKDFLKRHWPRLQLRTILLAMLLFAAAMPLFGGVSRPSVKAWMNTFEMPSSLAWRRMP